MYVFQTNDILKLKGVLRNTGVKVISTKEDDIKYLELTLGGTIVQKKNTEQKPNQIPYGYEMVDGELVPKEGEADVVAWMFEKKVQYSDNPPELLMECAREYLKETYSKRDYAKLTETDMKEQASIEEQEKQQIRSATMHYLKFGDVQRYPKSNVYVRKTK